MKNRPIDINHASRLSENRNTDLQMGKKGAYHENKSPQNTQNANLRSSSATKHENIEKSF
jgi:hypothetical protein